MRTITLLLALALTTIPAFAPTAAAAPVCESLSRTVPAAGNTLAVQTQACRDQYVSPYYTYDSFWNVTTGSLLTSSGEAVVLTSYSAHDVVRYATGERYDVRYHFYQVYAADPDGPVTATYVGGANQQQAYGNCFEVTGAGAQAYGPNTNTNAGHAFYGGTDRTLPCTSTDVQDSLP